MGVSENSGCSSKSSILIGWSIINNPFLDTLALLVGGFKYLLFSLLFGEDYHFDNHIFQVG